MNARACRSAERSRIVLQAIIVLVRVFFAVLLVAVGVFSALLGVYFALDHNRQVFDGAPLLLVAGLLFATAFFAAARKLLRANEPDPTTA
jgi:hypothetical protein